MAASQQISIVMVNWNAGELLKEAVLSVRRHHGGFVESLTLVDNGSTDDSLQKVRCLEGLPFPLRIIENKENRGFAAACNQGAESGSARYLLFLNPDTRLHSTSLAAVASFMDDPENGHVGICGIRLVDDSGRTCESAARFPSLRILFGEAFGLCRVLPRLFPPHAYEYSEIEFNRSVDQVMGAFFLIRRSLFEQCSGFDERFFVYYEEVDLSLRSKQQGYTSYLISSATAYHRGGGCSQKVKDRRLFYSLRSRLAFAKKHYRRLTYFGVCCITGLELPVRIGYFVAKRSWSDAINSYKGYRLLLEDILARAAAK